MLFLYSIYPYNKIRVRVDKTNTTFFGNADSQRNFTTNPIDLANPQANRNNPGFSQQERDKFADLISSGYVDSFRHLHPDEVKYSWWSYRQKARERNIGWRIDYFLVSDFAKDNIKSADIMTDIYGSDHCPVSLELDI